jgi:hypothetical protein
MRLTAILEMLRNAGEFDALVTNAAPQFGDTGVPLLGPRYLPERPTGTRGNIYRERNIQFRSPISSNISRYSALPKRASTSVGDFLVTTASMGHRADIAAEEYDALMELLNRDVDEAAALQITDFVTTTLLIPELHLAERQRWQAMVDALVKLRGENAFKENIKYPNPAGNRVVIADPWTSGTSDAPADLLARIDVLTGLGYTIDAIVSSTRMRNRFLNNAKTQKLVGSIVTVSDTNTLTTVPNGRANASKVNAWLDSENLPPWTLYDSQWKTEEGTGGRFLRDDAVVIIANAGQVVNVDVSDTQREILPNALGYYAIGRPAGRTEARRYVLVTGYENHPPRVEGEIVWEGIPVLLQPSAIAVLSESAYPT